MFFKKQSRQLVDIFGDFEGGFGWELADDLLGFFIYYFDHLYSRIFVDLHSQGGVE